MFKIIFNLCQHKTSLIFKKSDFNVNAKGFKLNSVICRMPLYPYPRNSYQYRSAYKPKKNTLLLCRKAAIHSGVFDKFRFKFSKGRTLKGAPRVKAIKNIYSSTKKARFTAKKSTIKGKADFKKPLDTNPKVKINTKVKSHKKPKSRNTQFLKGNRRPKLRADRSPQAQMDNQKKKIFGPHVLISMAGGLVEELTKAVYNVSITL